MNSMHDLKEKIVEGLTDLYEALYVAQEKIEETEVDRNRLRTTSLRPGTEVFSGWERSS